jgi:tetratricopeptide (TPR) repeat protein
MNQNSFLKIVFLFIFSITNFVAQNKSVDLKTVWENTKNSDSVRFKALADYYTLNNQTQPDVALKVLDYYYQLAKEKNNTKELYNVANNRGGIYRLKGEPDNAFNYYNEAQKLAEKLSDSVLIANIFCNKGNVYAYKKDYIKALQYFSNSFKIYKRIKDKKGESHMLTNIGSVYLYIQNFDLALEYYQKALSIIKNIDVPQRRIAVIYINIGWTNYELKKYKEAKLYYEKALKILELTNDKFFLVSCYSTLAKIHLELNEIEKATDYAEKNNTISNELKVPDFITHGQIIFAQLELKKGNIEVAREKGEFILEELDKNSDNELKLNLYDLLYKVYLAENNSKKSLEMYQKFGVYKDSIQLERNKLTLVREVVKNEFDDLLVKNEQKLKKEKVELESKQQQKTYGIILVSILLIASIIFYFNRNLKKNRKKRDELLQEIEKLKRNEVNNRVINSEIEKLESKEANNQVVNSEIEKLEPKKVNSLVANSIEFQLVREKIEKSINRKLNATDWNVLNILLKEPDISNKEIAEKAFLSVDGIGSSLRRMYMYFDIKESKYKKISLIMEAIKASS